MHKQPLKKNGSHVAKSENRSEKNASLSPRLFSEQVRIRSRRGHAKLAHEGAEHYQRLRHLPALLSLWPHELDDFTIEGTEKLIARLEPALASERRRGRARHWAYDLNRHLALASALKAERHHLAKLRNKATTGN